MAKDTNSNTAESKGKPGIDDLEKYLLRTSREVINLLKSMIKKPDIITASIPGSGQAVMTAVIDVLPKKKLLVLDYGPNHALNKKLLAAEKIVFTARHDMVETRFSSGSLKQVKYNGGPAFATPIPTSVLYLQRREYFRIQPLISHPVYCQLSREDANPLKLEIIDICIRGLSLQDSNFELKVSEDDRFDNCKLILPANPKLSIGLEVCYLKTINLREGLKANRVGGHFTNLNLNDEYVLQRFINMVQLEQNALSKD